MAEEGDALVDLLQHAGALKRLPRRGWVLLGVPSPESVADHSYRVALMTLLVAHVDPNVNTERALVLALCHDLPEAIAGDTTPFDEQIRRGEVDPDRLFRSSPAYSASADRAKRQAEGQALQTMTGDLPQALRRLIVDAWEEYEAGDTPEARLVHQIDKLEALLQANEYREMMPEIQVDSFRLGALDRVRDERLVQLLQAINSMPHAPDGNSSA
jgi:putative hydrolases of HD superfamily